MPEYESTGALEYENTRVRALHSHKEERGSTAVKHMLVFYHEDVVVSPMGK